MAENLKENNYFLNYIFLNLKHFQKLKLFYKKIIIIFL